MKITTIRITVGALESIAVMNKRLRSTQRVNYVTRKNVDPSRKIVVDSGASEYMIYDITLFKRIEKIDPVEVGLTNGHMVTARYKRWINMMLGNNTNLNFGNVYYTPELCLTLIICGSLERRESPRLFLVDSVNIITG